MSTRSRVGGEVDELVHLDGAHRRRLLDEDVLAGFERALRERVVRRHRRRDHDGVERVVREHVVERRSSRGRADTAPRAAADARRRGRRAT